MKANHNNPRGTLNLEQVVVNINKSKNESKSQQDVEAEREIDSCGKYQ